MNGNQKFRIWRAAVFLLAAFGFTCLHDWLLSTLLVRMWGKAMTLPWFLNPWAEVRRLRAWLKSTEEALGEILVQLQHLTSEQKTLYAENADLRRRIVEMEEAIEDYQSARFACEAGSMSRTGIPELNGKIEAREDLFRLVRKKMTKLSAANDNETQFMKGRLCARKSWPDIGMEKLDEAIALAFRSGNDAFGDGWVVELHCLAEKYA